MIMTTGVRASELRPLCGHEMYRFLSLLSNSDVFFGVERFFFNETDK